VGEAALTTAITAPTETSSPSAKCVETSVPVTMDSTSMAALSVSTSSSGCPRVTASPGLTSQRRIRTAEPVVARSGIVMGVAVSLMDNAGFRRT
jgi:hypothetical protein